MAETTAAGGCRKRRRREITAGDIETLPIEAYTQEESTKGSYSSYIKPFIQFAIDNGWTSHMYPEAMQRIDLTADYIQKNEITPICSSVNIETYLKVFHQSGRRRGTGIVSRAMADQFMKAVSNQRALVISKQLPVLQTAG
mmetsp:Transcript_2186/g.4516  ORF Transcript_2186/g.4516 Transcript_2186/m.4516 type:complete len:141 (-) Transcript_2186:216-638(-)